MRYATCHPDRKHAALGMCTQCYQRYHREKNREHFMEYNRQWRHANSERRSNYIKQWRQENPDKVRETKWRHNGIKCTYERYKEREKEQDGYGILCGRVEKERSLAVDHNHISGHIRGLLCRPCNQAMGVLEKRGVDFHVLAAYIDRSSG